MTQIPDFFTIRERLCAQPELFNAFSLEVFLYQHENNPIYREYCQLLNCNPSAITHYTQIPFLPIQFFKSHEVCCFQGIWAEKIYTSSGTTGQAQSRHYVRKYRDYFLSFSKCFEIFYGSINEYCVLALLPSYLEREGSSLVDMAQELITLSEHPKSGFYLNNYQELIETIHSLRLKKQKILLLGVTHALVDLTELGPFDWSGTVIMETGGMKGRRKEIIREELHAMLQVAFNVDAIHSEYGMTELLSQAYSTGKGLFTCPPWMKILTREINDPFQINKSGKTGGVNIIDLANIESCSFIATQDLARTHQNEQFEVLGRFDNSDLRGCNLMIN